MDSTSTNQPTDDIWLGEYRDRLPPTLNVLTILTIIWNAFSFITHFFSFAISPYNYRNAANTEGAFDQMPPLFKSLIGDTREAARLAYVNRVPILLIGLVGTFLCLFGAIKMRKRKKIGFTLYVIGDLLPLIDIIFFTTVSTFTGISLVLGYGIALLFVILYAKQLKYMR